MSNQATRREFLKTGVTAAVGAASVAGATRQADARETASAKTDGEHPFPLTGDPFPRLKGPHLKLSCCAYSFNKILPRGKKPGKMTMEGFVDFCAGLNLDGTELTSYYFPPDADAAYFKRIRRRAFLNGLEVSGTAVGNTFTIPPGTVRDKQIASVKRWIDLANEFAAPTIRIFAGSKPPAVTVEKARKWFVECMESCLPHAEKRGVFLALENHGGIVTTSDEVLACVRLIKSDWFGLNVDTGNFREADPYKAIAKCAPYAVNVHVKAHVQSTQTKKRTKADYDRIARIMAGAGYRGYISLEYEEKDDPTVAVPKHLAALRSAIAKSRS